MLKKAAIISLIASSALFAEPSSFYSKTLIGIEGGYSNFDVEKQVSGASSVIKKVDAGNIGIKIGAQSQNYRLFLSARYYDGSGVNYVATYGGELQYLRDFNPKIGWFFGLNTGYTDGRVSTINESSSRDLSGFYAGGDIGINYHISKDYDFEIGARAMFQNITDTKKDLDGNYVTYKLDNIVTGYFSIIYKFDM